MRETRFENQSFDDPSIYENDTELIKMKLSLGANPNFIRLSNNQYQRPALSHAVRHKHSEVIDIFSIFVKNQRTDLNKGDINGYTPLMYACMSYVSDEVGV